MRLKTPIRRRLIWLGNTKKTIRFYSKEVRKQIGDELQLIQFGGMPRDAKPLKGTGSGIFEIVTDFYTDTYRTVVAVKIGASIYVLHTFKKKSKKGIAAPKQDIALIQQRLREAREHAQNA